MKGPAGLPPADPYNKSAGHQPVTLKTHAHGHHPTHTLTQPMLGHRADCREGDSTGNQPETESL